MEPKLRIPDPETRARTMALLKEARIQADLTLQMLDETLALADAHLLRQQEQMRAFRKPQPLPSE
jgi:hypothetical protein